MFTNHIKSTAIAIIAIFACAINALAIDKLYLIGTAVGGWSLDNIENNMMSKDGNIYTWAGHLNEGELKFLTHNDWLPSWGPSPNGIEIKEGTISCDIEYRSTKKEDDNKFNVTEAGFYRIKLNLNGGYTRADITSYPAAVYPFGTGTSDGYAVEMRETSFGSGEYKGNRISLKNNGKLVFLKQQGDGDYYGPATDGTVLSAVEGSNMQEYTTLRNVKLADNLLTLSTDKACYKPGETVTFTSSVPAGTYDGLKIRYRHLGKTIDEQDLTSSSWTWTAPSDDYKGYMAEIYTTDGKTDVIHGTIAIDVSSDWKMFPRYGFIATFSPVSVYGEDYGKTDAKIASEMAWLNRCHINGVQFQDWHWKHHNPCPPYNEDGTLWDCYQDLANRWNSSNVIKKYIATQHGYGMKSIFYNLAFGVLDDKGYSDAEKQMAGWDNTWYLYKDVIHSERDKHGLPSDWKSDIYLTNPANANWLAWMKARNTEVYNAFDFDGYQIDQLGGRGNTYDYDGNKIDLWETYTTFINAMKQAHPDKRLIMNAVSEYGTWGIARTHNVDMFYNEVWGWTEDEKKFDNLFRIIKDNEKMYSDIKTVFAAYMNYGAHGREKVTKEYFNTPGILLTDATIFALGGAHLELGDHMLCDEYFPNSDMMMSDELKTAIEHYYDFHTAYENLLRGSGTELTTAPSCSTVSIKPWYSTNTNGNISVTSMETGKVMSYSRKVGDQQVINLINFRNANSTSWCDYDASMPAPTEVKNIPVTVTTSDAISRVWVASPDCNAGAMQQLRFTQQGNSVTFTVPNLKYWTMIVME